MRLFLVVIFILVMRSFQSCSTKAYPDEKFGFDPLFLRLFNSILAYDTMEFKGPDNRHKVFVVAGLDSTVSNKKGWFINEMPYKLLRFQIREQGGDTLSLERHNEIYLNKYPERSSTKLGIQFNNFYFDDTVLPRKMHDTLQIYSTFLFDYYVFKTTLGSKDSDDVTTLYIDSVKGLRAFRTSSGAHWVRVE